MNHQAMPQLPVSCYIEPETLAQEQARLFDRLPRYVGHELMVPQVGDYYTLEWMAHGEMLRRNDSGLYLMSNICRHRQAIMLKGRGHDKHIVCPLHRWAYDAEGQQIGAPRFPDNPCLDLSKQSLSSWNGLLFAGGDGDLAARLAGMQAARHLDFSGFALDRVVCQDYPFNWKTFIEVYLEDYHVAPYHPGLGHFVTCADLEWEFGDAWSVQTVGINGGLKRPGSEIYRRWHEAVLQRRGGLAPDKGAVWLTLYPNVMVEWYPDTLVVSFVIPRGPQACTNVVEFYYPQDILQSHRDYIDAEQAAYLETAIEDEDICLRMDEGRRALYAKGLSEVGPYQSPMEDGMRHFHQWYRRAMALE